MIHFIVYYFLKKSTDIFAFVWVVKKRLTALGVLVTQKFFYLSTVSRITLSSAVNFQSDELHDFVQTWYNLRNVKNIHGGLLLLVK